MNRRAELLAKNAKIRSTTDISDEEVKAVGQSHRARSGQGSFAQRQRLEDRVQELEAKLEQAAGDLLPLAAIVPNPWQPRRIFDDAELQKLAASISEIGLIQPIIVRSVSNRDTPYQIVAGERRFKAHELLGRTEIRAIVLDVSDPDMAALALAENMDRTDLSAYEIAVAIRNAEAFFPNRKNFAEALGLNRTALYKYFAFFKLPDFVIDDLELRPDLIGRDAADAIASLLGKEGEKGVESLSRLWPRVKAGDLEQGKIVPLIKAALQPRGQANASRDITKLFVGKKQAGSITRDSAALTVKIRASALTPEKEAELRSVMARLFPAGG